jgi:hypothetical protein
LSLILGKFARLVKENIVLLLLKWDSLVLSFYKRVVFDSWLVGLFCLRKYSFIGDKMG